MNRFSSVTLSNILAKLYAGKDYRGEVISVIQDGFLAYTIDFFKKVVSAKCENIDITKDWYEREFIQSASLSKEEIACNSGINKKTIGNKYGSKARSVVIKASSEHFTDLKNSIEYLVENDSGLELTLTLNNNKASVELTLSETLIVVNSLTVKRAAIRGGAWSSVGKRIEKPLMLSLCRLYGVDKTHYEVRYKKEDYSADETAYSREIDFFLFSGAGKELNVEVKLMGKGNPESADAVIARDTSIFVADTLSETNRRQLNDLGISWIELRSKKGFRKFPEILDAHNIPYSNKDITDDDIKSVIDINNTDIYG